MTKTGRNLLRINRKNMQTNLERNIRKKLKIKKILLISHVVLGYKNNEITAESVKEMNKAGVDLIELQIPFSDPQADGPFLTTAQQQAVEKNFKVRDGFNFARKICKKYQNIDFVFMTYYNIVFKYGVSKFINDAATVGIKGVIVPDLPIEEAREYLVVCQKNKIAPIFLFTPTTTEKRMREINKVAGGFIYCQARVGVTGKHTKFGKDEIKYIKKCRNNTTLPIAMGFGIQNKKDVDFLKNKIDIAICCTQAVKILDQSGSKAMGEFLRNLR